MDESCFDTAFFFFFCLKKNWAVIYKLQKWKYTGVRDWV